MTLRQKIIKVSYKANACHIGSALSCVEIIQSIGNRNPFIFAKASGISAYYCMKYDEKKAVKLLKKYPLPSKEAGLIWSGGSLGQGLSVACGIALATWKRTYVLLGDGDLQEGQTWEAIMFASHHGLPVIAVIDRNRLQALGRTEDICGLDPLKEKFLVFGWDVREVFGHSVEQINKAIKEAKQDTPLVIIADTTKGKGVSFMEDNNNWHYKNLDADTYERAILELE